MTDSGFICFHDAAVCCWSSSESPPA